MKKLSMIVILLTINTITSLCQEHMINPEGMIHGGAFIDRFETIETIGSLRNNTWGADNVVPRDVEIGIEDDNYSYWGGNIVVDDKGVNHLFVCRWPENITRQNGKKSGHELWWDSDVVHAVSKHPLGPYQVVEEIGKGHNPEIYRLKDGSYIIGVAFHDAYKASSLDGPWKQIESSIDFLDISKIKKGGREHTNKTNRTYITQEDGSILMMNKTGHVFISDQADEHFVQVTNQSAYPVLPKPAHLEDPVIWKDEVQYHLIVNDCIGRSALYLRSQDGLNWKWEKGVAYNPTIIKHTDGTTEDWWKLERPKVRLDQYGRVTHMNFAVIDTLKSQDKADDKHSSKNIIVPLKVSRRLSVLNSETITRNTQEIEILIKAEEDFNPHKDIDFHSIRFGTAEEVNFGRGSKLTTKRKSNEDLILVFDGIGNNFTKDHFAGKLIGRTADNKLLFGYAKLP